MGETTPSTDLLGVGIYSFPDAARLIGAKARELRRWLKGYAVTQHGQRHRYEPLWTPQLAGAGIDGVGFRDLIELRFVRTFVQAGVPLVLIRRAIDEIRERLGTTYPFTSTAFKTDGKRIFMEILDANGDTSLVDVVKRQNVMTKVIGPSLREGIELNVDDEATRWFPVHGSQAVVLDPARRFGQPILTEHGIPTATLAAATRAEGGDVARVARIYEIPPTAVRQAVRYERQVAA